MVEKAEKLPLDQTLTNSLRIDQFYSTEFSDAYGTNEIIADKLYKLDIFLVNLMTRKNMAYKKVARRIDFYFLVEFICVLLQEEGIWNQKYCGTGVNCNIQKTIKKMLLFF